MKSIIMSADDYAQSAEIENGILHLIRLGRLTATSCLTLSPRWQMSAKLLTPDIRQNADIGLHLDFTQYAHPLRHSLPTLIIKTALRMLSKKQIKHSIQIQLDAFEDALGTGPDYVDGHQHVHQLPQIREVLIQELSHRYANHLPWIRIAAPPVGDGLKAVVIKLLGAKRLEQLVIANGLPYSKSLLGVYAFHLNADDYRQQLNVWLSNLETTADPIAMMCHPATGVKDFTQQDDPILAARFAEYAVFADDAFVSLLADKRIRLIRGSQFMTS
ncbi:MAG: hypothetical protein B7X95_09955 [Methylophilaceae bacterium 17-44-8]|jgi:predicted glycoside hydrolase/deacetylase ChbG (UPF0249 family)|nr:MAG: hypothetical protein B7Y48_04950 [Methylophilales bacterium 28-44-11]OZA04509.1 MAG: hypothetical protein B7X95_09955 [Methylophilaceae bacterium 17-44-8]